MTVRHLLPLTSTAVVTSLAFCLACPECQAKNSADASSNYKPVSTFDAMQRGRGADNSRLFTLKSQAALRNNDLERAVKYGKKAVDADNNDLDARVAYGNVLFQFLNTRDKTDINYPSIRNEAIKTWLLIYRNVVGEESGTNFKGIGLPMASKFYADENRVGLAKARLKEICGRTPKFFETNRKYLKRVLEPEVKLEGTILSSVDDVEESSESNKAKD